MIEALFVGGEMNGRVEALARPFPTHSFRMYRPNAQTHFLGNTHKGVKAKAPHMIELTYELDTEHYEPWVYVLKGLSRATADERHREAIKIAFHQPATIVWGKP